MTRKKQEEKWKYMLPEKFRKPFGKWLKYKKMADYIAGSGFWVNILKSYYISKIVKYENLSWGKLHLISKEVEEKLKKGVRYNHAANMIEEIDA